jgi:hypothetical protein
LTDGSTATLEVQALLRALATGRDVAELGAAYGETAALLAETARWSSQSRPTASASRSLAGAYAGLPTSS